MRTAHLKLSLDNLQYLDGMNVDVIQTGVSVIVIVPFFQSEAGLYFANLTFDALTTVPLSEPEDVEDIKLEPEEVTADAEGEVS